MGLWEEEQCSERVWLYMWFVCYCLSCTDSYLLYFYILILTSPWKIAFPALSQFCTRLLCTQLQEKFVGVENGYLEDSLHQCLY